QTESTKVYSAKLKREMEKVLVGAKLKTVNMGIMGAEQAPLMMTVVGASPEDALETARTFADILRGVAGASELELTSEDGNTEISVQVDRYKMNTQGLNVATVGMTKQTAFTANTDTKSRAGDQESR